MLGVGLLCRSFLLLFRLRSSLIDLGFFLLLMFRGQFGSDRMIVGWAEDVVEIRMIVIREAEVISVTVVPSST